MFRSRLAEVAIPAGTVTEYVLRGAEGLGAKPAVIDAATGQALSYRELIASVGSFAAGLAARGFGRGDVLAILAPNIPKYPVVFHGVASAGGAVTTLNPLYTAGEIAVQLRASGAMWLVTVPALVDKAMAAGDGLEIIVVGGGPATGTVPFSSLLAGGAPPAVVIDPATDLAALPYSSGTTGLSKGVMLRGYFGDNAASARCFDGDGFYRSGDVGHLDAEGRLFVVDRIKELIKYKGYQRDTGRVRRAGRTGPAGRDPVLRRGARRAV